eukprot:2246352-Amphidinium_carterae.1
MRVSETKETNHPKCGDILKENPKFTRNDIYQQDHWLQRDAATCESNTICIHYARRSSYAGLGRETPSNGLATPSKSGNMSCDGVKPPGACLEPSAHACYQKD